MSALYLKRHICLDFVLRCYGNNDSRSLSRKMSHFPKPLWLELLSCTESIFVGSGKPSLADSSFDNYLTIARAWQPLPLRKGLFAG